MRILNKAISGTAGARTHTQRAGGTVAYQRPCPVNRNTVAQCRRRGIFANAAREWAQLSPANQRKVAELAAEERRVDSLGRSTRVLPFNYFCRARMRGEQIPPANFGVAWINSHFRDWQTIEYGIVQMSFTEEIPELVELALLSNGGEGLVYVEGASDPKVFSYVEAGTTGIKFDSEDEPPFTLTRGVWRFDNGWEYPLAGLPAHFDW